MSNWRDTRRSFVVCAVACAAASLLIAASPAGAVDPAVREYSLNFPNAKGKSYPGAEAPSPRPSELGPIITRALGETPNGRALATIATSPELGASATSSGRKLAVVASGESAGGETPSALTAAARSLDSLLVLLGLLALLGMIGFLAVLARAPRAGTKT